MKIHYHWILFIVLHLITDSNTSKLYIRIRQYLHPCNGTQDIYIYFKLKFDLKRVTAIILLNDFCYRFFFCVFVRFNIAGLSSHKRGSNGGIEPEGFKIIVKPFESILEIKQINCENNWESSYILLIPKWVYNAMVVGRNTVCCRNSSRRTM